MICPNCGAILTSDMIISGMCFSCGESFIPYSGKPVCIIQYDGNIVSFPEIEDKDLLNTSQTEIKTLLEENLGMINRDSDTYLEKINSQQQATVFATIKNNTKLFHLAVEKLTSMAELEIGERIFLFYSNEKRADSIGLQSLASNGYLLTNRKILFWNGNKLTTLLIKNLYSLELDPILDLWYFNESAEYTITNKCCTATELSLIFSLIFTIAKESTKILTEPKNDILKKVVEKKNEVKEEEIKKSDTYSSPIADKLTEAKNLYEDGLLTKSEYISVKQKILNKYF